MTLLHLTDHRDEPSAALSIAANRASKVRKLALADRPDMARRNAYSLAVDVLEYISDSGCGIATARDLANVAANAVEASDA